MLLEGKKVYVGPFLKRQDRPDDGEVRFTNVYVKNMAESVTSEKLDEMFSEFGEVTSAVVMTVSKLLSEPLKYWQGCENLAVGSSAGAVELPYYIHCRDLCACKR